MNPEYEIKFFLLLQSYSFYKNKRDLLHASGGEKLQQLDEALQVKADFKFDQNIRLLLILHFLDFISPTQS